MTEKSFDIKDNFKRRYAALIRLQQYLQKWLNSKQLKFTSSELGTLNRMITSLKRCRTKLEDEYYILFKEDSQSLRKYVKDDNGNNNK